MPVAVEQRPEAILITRLDLRQEFRIGQRDDGYCQNSQVLIRREDNIIDI